MRTIELPVLRSTDVIAVTIERATLNDIPIWVATVRESGSVAARRRWFPDELVALTYAAEQADRAGLLLIDLRHGSDTL